METPHPHAVFWIETSKIATNPFQPRKFFDEARLQDLSDSIRRYGVLQPIVVTRKEEFTPEGGMVASYELIAGERRLRASKMAGLQKIPAIVREDDSTDEEKLELAILENLQREDLNPVDRARSFGRLIDEFGLTHAQVGERLGKSREYVSNSMRLLALPEHILNALSQGRISEGHTRPLLMLKERPEEQETLFMQLINSSGSMTVREAEKFARSIAKEKQRVNKDLDPEMKEIQQKLSNRLGAKVSIDKSAQGGRVTIEFGNKEDLRLLLEKVKREVQRSGEMISSTMDSVVAAAPISVQRSEIASEQEPEVARIGMDFAPEQKTQSLAQAESVQSREQEETAEEPDTDQSQYSFNSQLKNIEPETQNAEVQTMVAGSDFVPGRSKNVSKDPFEMMGEKTVDYQKMRASNRPEVPAVSPEEAEAFKKMSIDRNTGDTDVQSHDLQKEIESFSAQYQSRMPEIDGVSTDDTHETVMEDLSRFVMRESSPVETSANTPQQNTMGMNSGSIVKGLAQEGIGIENTNSINQQSVSNGAAITQPLAEVKAQFVGQDFTPSEPVISSTGRVSVGQDFVPGGQPQENKGDENEPFDLSKFTI